MLIIIIIIIIAATVRTGRLVANLRLARRLHVALQNSFFRFLSILSKRIKLRVVEVDAVPTPVAATARLHNRRMHISVPFTILHLYIS